MRPGDWKPRELAPGQIDWQARKIAAEIRRNMPETLKEAIILYGPLRITHVSPRRPHSDGWVMIPFLTSLSQKPDIFFLGIEYEMPYFRQWMEQAFQTGEFRELPQAIEISEDPEGIPWITPEGDIVYAHESDPLGNPWTKLCNLADFGITIS